MLKKVKPDLIFVPFPHAYSVPLEDVGKIPLVVQTWGAEIIPMAPEIERERLRKIALLNRADRILASSDCLAQATKRYAGLDFARVQTIYWGVDLNQFSPPVRPVHDPIIGFVKGFTPKYGLEYLLRAMPKVLRAVPQARVMVLSEGPRGTELRAMAHQLGVDHAIIWNGAVRHELMSHYFSQMAISVMPSTHESETLGVAGIESQAMCVPVVASRIGGLPESISHGETGVLVPPRDPEALADAIVDLLKDHEKRADFGRRGRRLLRTDLTGGRPWRLRYRSSTNWCDACLMKIITVAGARPNFMKVAPLMWEIGRRAGIDAFLVHTGQHYDERMSQLFFEELRDPRPDVDLGVGSGSHAVQTAEVMKRFEPVVLEQKPDAVVVVGDVNSTIACA